MKRMNADVRFRAGRGYLSDEEKRLIINEIVAGRPYVEIGEDWLIDGSAVAKIARAHSIHKCPRKLNSDVVRSIRREIRGGARTGLLAKKFDVHYSTIAHIKSGRAWKSTK